MRNSNTKSTEQLEKEVESLKYRLMEAEDMLHAIRSGDVDALIVDGAEGPQVFTLKSADHTYRILVEEMNESALILSKDGTILYCNESFGKMLQLPLEIVIGSHFFSYIQKEYLQSIMKLLSKTSADTSKMEINLKGKDHLKIIPVKISIKIIKEQELPIFHMIITDMTEEKLSANQIRLYQQELETKIEELKISNAELEQFAYVASHDLMEPLRMVSSFTTLLLRKLKVEDDTSMEYKEYILSGIMRMESMIKDLLDYSRVGKRDVEFELVDCNVLIEKVKANLYDQIKESGAQIFYKDLPIIRAVPGLLIQVFQNLIHNAIKFKKENLKPYIEIMAIKHKDEFAFCVKDNGIGIDPQFAERIFIIFQRLHTKDQYSGSGIGLSITKKIIEFHGGRIWLESHLEKGCIFHFTIPETGKY